MLQLIKLAVEFYRSVAVPQQSNNLKGFFKAADRFCEIKAIRNGVFGFTTA